MVDLFVVLVVSYPYDKVLGLTCSTHKVYKEGAKDDVVVGVEDGVLSYDEGLRLVWHPIGESI